MNNNGNFLHTVCMKAFVLTISMLIFSSLAAFNGCSAMQQKSKAPVPDDNTRITAPDEDGHNGVIRQHRMPRFIPRFKFEN